jgi:hypothetical protein
MGGLRLALAAAALFGAVSTPATAGLIANGGFETGDLSGWTSSGSFVFSGVDDADPHSGTFGFFSGEPDGLDFIAQDLATAAGATYRLTYWLANRDGRRPTSFRVEWDGIQVTSFTNSSAFDYTKFSFDLVAQDASTTLQFGFRQFFDYWVFDDVSVELVSAPVLVPEPGTLALFGSALLGIAAVRRRSRR